MLTPPSTDMEPGPSSAGTTEVTRQRPNWEAQIISWCITAVVIVFTICVVIGMVGLLIFGLNVLSHHTG